ncbi:MAG TPA: class I SAM-dependent methyltransferase [Lacipirellulaceae bacterium]|nr:class I SAM-dependent methyltransferase [Lacipirellulaceae bacterium]
MDAALYDELHRVEQTHWWFQARRHIVWSLVRRYVSGIPNRRLRVCELGCGTGGNLVALAERYDVVGVECSPQALAYARHTLGDRVRYGRLPHEIGLPPENFDVVLMTDVLEHIEDDAASAIAALKLLRPGGVLVATVPAYQWLYAPRDAHHHHVRRYGKRQFRSLWRRPDAQMLLLSHYNMLLFPPAAAVRILNKWLPQRDAPGDLSVPPQFVNGVLARMMRCEKHLLGRLPLPLGLSLIAAIQKIDSNPNVHGRSAA